MNNPSPFAPQSSTPEQKNSNRTRVRWYVFGILSVHVVGLVALLMIGCRKPQPEAENIPAPDTNNLFADANLETPTNVDTSAPTNPPTVTTSAPPVVDTTPQPALPPVEPAAGQEYTIVKGDNFSTIAKKFPGVTAKAIQEANPAVQPTKLKIGQKIQIPAGSSGASASGVAPAADSSMSSGSEKVYSVKSGDTLTTIAKSHHVSVKALRSANSLKTDKIRVGQKLKIPVNAAAPAPAPIEAAPALPPTTPAPATAPTNY